MSSNFTELGTVDASIPFADMQLKLSITSGALRYFIYSNTSSQVIYFGEHQILRNQSQTEMLHAIQRIFEKDEALNFPYGQVTIVSNDPYTIVPLGFENQTEQILSEHIVELELIVQTNPSTQITEWLNARFPVVKFTHAVSSFLRDGRMESGKLYVHIESDFFDVLMMNSEVRLQFANRYSFKSANDFIYHLLNVAQRLEFNRNEGELLLAGEISAQSSIYNMCYKYFRNVYLIKRPENVKFAKAFSDFPEHLYYPTYIASI